MSSKNRTAGMSCAYMSGVVTRMNRYEGLDIPEICRRLDAEPAIITKAFGVGSRRFANLHKLPNDKYSQHFLAGLAGEEEPK